jgi:hypothetical protein
MAQLTESSVLSYSRITTDPQNTRLTWAEIITDKHSSLFWLRRVSDEEKNILLHWILIAEEKTAAELEECYFSEDELGLKL